MLPSPGEARWKCQICGHIALESALLRGTSPFDPLDELLACPLCKAVSGAQILPLCDVPECHSLVSTGWPSPDGYRNTCHDHWVIGQAD